MVAGALKTRTKRSAPPQRPPTRSQLPILDLLGFSDPETLEFESTTTTIRPADPTPSGPGSHTREDGTYPSFVPRSLQDWFDSLFKSVTDLTRPRSRPAPKRLEKPLQESSEHPSIFDLLPRLSDLRSGGESENTGTLIERLWEATDTYEPATSWAPATPSLSQKRPRWGLIVLLILVAIAGALLVANRPDQDADRQMAARSTQETIDAARSSLAEARTVVDLIGNTEATGEELSSAAVTLTALDSSARELTAAGDSLIEDAEREATGRALIRAGSLATTTGRRLGDALTYRLVFARAFALPDLPAEAGITEIADVGFEIASMISDTERSLERLPGDPTLDGHRRDAEEALASIEAATPDYLQALRDGESLSAQVHANQIRRLGTDTHAALFGPLRQLADEVGIAFDGYEAELEAASTRLP